MMNPRNAGVVTPDDALTRAIAQKLSANAMNAKRDAFMVKGGSSASGPQKKARKPKGSYQGPNPGTLPGVDPSINAPEGSPSTYRRYGAVGREIARAGQPGKFIGPTARMPRYRNDGTRRA